MQPEEDPDAGWVAALSGRTLRASEGRLSEAAGERRLFSHLDREHRREGRSSYVEIDAPLELHALVRLLRPREVVEVGVSSGVSSAYLLHALGQNGTGTLHSVDRPSRPSPVAARSSASWSLPPGRASGWAVPSRLRRRWDLRLGDKAELIPQLADELDRVDLVVYDVPHNEADLDIEFARLDPLMAAGAVAIVDHGPSGDLCRALRRWATLRAAKPVRRQGLGLYGIRCGNPGARPPARRSSSPGRRSAPARARSRRGDSQRK